MDLGYLLNAEVGARVPPLSDGKIPNLYLPVITPESINAESKGAVFSAIAAHEATTNPHSQYSLVNHSHQALAVGADPRGTAFSVIETHVQSDSPHSQYSLTTHTHSAENIGAISIAQKGSVGGVATLDANKKIPSEQLPPLAITETFVVNTTDTMLALNAQVGDVAVRSDLNKSFILKNSPATLFLNWQELLTPTDTIVSVNGKTGVVFIKAADVEADERGEAMRTISTHKDEVDPHPNYLNTTRLVAALNTITWYNLTLVNGWTGINTQYSKLSNGLIIMRGLLSKSNKNSGEIISTLPLSYRPPFTLRFATVDATKDSQPFLDINSQGQIIFNNLNPPNNTIGLTLSGIIYVGN